MRDYGDAAYAALETFYASRASVRDGQSRLRPLGCGQTVKIQKTSGKRLMNEERLGTSGEDWSIFLDARRIAAMRSSGAWHDRVLTDFFDLNAHRASGCACNCGVNQR